MWVTEINEDKHEAISEYVEKSLRYMGKVMQCLEEVKAHKRRQGHNQEEDDTDEDYERKPASRYSRF